METEKNNGTTNTRDNIENLVILNSTPTGDQSWDGEPGRQNVTTI